MGERLSLQVALEGAEHVISQLKSIDKIANKEDKRKIKLQIDTAKNNLAKVGTQLKQQQNIFNRISSKAPRFAEQYRSKLRDIGREMKPLYKEMSEINGMMKNPHFGVISNEGRQALQGRMDYLRQYANSLKETARHYHAMEQGWKEYGSAAYRRDRNGAYNFDKQLMSRAQENLTQAGKQMMLRVNPEVDTGKLQGELSSHEYEVPVRAKLMEAYNKWSGMSSRVGSSLITLGNTLQTITSPFDSVLRGAAYGIGYGALNKFAEGLTSGFQRYDILHTFPKRMAVMGQASETKAKEAIGELKESVMGLPTGLDEMVDLQQRFVIASDDFNKSTKLAIAANNAFLAGGANALQREQGTRQLTDYLSAGELQESEWQSLFKSSNVMITAIAKDMGYKSTKAFKSELKKNQIDPEDFFKSLEKVGSKGGVLYEAAQKSQHTFDAIANNVKNVLSDNMNQLIETFDELFQTTTGGDVIDNLMGFRDAINGMGEGVRNWIKANPDKIMDFYNRIKNFDWQGLGAGFLESTTKFLDLASKVIGFFGGKDASALGRAIVRINLIGKALTLGGGLLKGFSWAFGLAGVLKTMRAIGKVEDAGKVVKTAEEITKAGTVVSKIPMAWQDVANKAVVVAAIPAVAGAMLLAAKALQEFDKVNLSWGLVGKVGAGMAAIAAFIGEAAFIGSALASNPLGWITTAGAAVGGTAIAAAAGDMILVAKALNGIATAKIPDGKQISRVTKAVVTAIDALKNLELPNLGADAGERTKNLGGVFEGIGSVANTLFNLSELDLTKDKIKNAKKKVKAVKKEMVKLKQEIAEAFGSEIVSSELIQGGNSRKGQKKTTVKRQVADKEALKEGVEQTSYIDQYLTNITTFVDKMTEFSDKMKDIKKIADKFKDKDGDKTGWEVLTQEVVGMVQQMGDIMGSIDDITREKLSGSGDISTNVENVKKSISSLIKAMRDIRTLINENAGAGMSGEQIGKYIDGLLSGISGGMDKVYNLSAQSETFRIAAKDVKSAIKSLQSIETVEIDFGAFESTVTTATKMLKNAAKKIGKAWDKLKSTTDKIQNISKIIFVAVHINGVDSAVAQMNSAAARLNTARANLNAAMNGGGGSGGGGGGGNTVYSSKGLFDHTGGYIDGRGRAIYRASGGDIPLFKRRGSDTVPAMLTPGEYVNRRAAVAHFGAGFFERLNHLDLEGALRSISTRASRFAGGNTYNITNKTNNARVVQHIHTHDTNYAFKRANRFVEAL